MKTKTRIEVLAKNYESMQTKHMIFAAKQFDEIAKELVKLKGSDEAAYYDLMLKLPDSITGGFSGV